MTNRGLFQEFARHSGVNSWHSLNKLWHLCCPLRSEQYAILTMRKWWVVFVIWKIVDFTTPL